MKKHVAFLCILSFVLGLFLYLAAHFNERSLFALHGTQEELSHFLDGFREHHQPLMEINFTALYGADDRFEILHPSLDVRRLSAADGAPLCDDDRARNPQLVDASCQVEAYPLSDEDAVAKDIALVQFLSGNAPLPRDFLNRRPFTNEFNRSYAWQLAERGGQPYQSRDWVAAHLSFFRVAELPEVMRKFGVSRPEFSLIATLGEDEIKAVIRGQPLVLTKDYLLLKNQSRLAFSPLSYWVYRATEVRTALQNGEYELTAQGPGYCLERLGNACWSYNSKHALAYLYRYSLAILCLVAVLFLAILAFYLKHLYDKNEEHRRNRLSLQVLSHEFRTPVASSLLLLEELSRARLAEEDQDRLARLSTEIYRLQRVLEISRRYLQADTKRIRFEPATIPSINTWIQDFASEQAARIECRLLAVDQGIRADPFWLKFVLGNLIQNALAHGAEPVVLCLELRRGRLRITVEDQGHCEFTSLRQMTEAFVKSPRSQGMGLGLNIVSFIVREWGGELQFSRTPTAFSVVLEA